MQFFLRGDKMNTFNISNPNDFENSMLIQAKNYAYDTELIRNGTIQANINNNIELFLTFSHYYNIVCSLLKFKSLPNNYNSNYIMQLICEYGTIAIVKENDDFFILPYNPKTLKSNYTGEPVEIEITEFSLFSFGKIQGVNLPTKRIFKNTDDEKEFVIINSTPTNLPMFLIIYYYCLKLIDVQQSIDNNLFVLQQPIIFSGGKNHKNDIMQLYQKFFQKVRAFFMTKDSSLTDNKIEVLDTKAKDYLQSLEAHKDYVKKEFFEFFGINAVPYEKKERLIVDEVNSNNMLLELVQSVYYNTINESIEKVNDTFNLEIELEFNINGFLNNQKGGEVNASDDESL